MESPFNDILHTNTVPSDSECQSIRDFLVGSRQKIAHLTNEIVATQALLNQLTKKRQALDEFVAAHLALVSPFRRLPTDIMQEIFVASLPSGRNSIITEQDAPLLLCHVCRPWRSLALSTPRLWASLHISVPSNDRTLSSITDAVNGWLSRSGILPLSISVASRETHDPPTILLTTLIGFSLRWEHISFMFHTYQSLDPLASLSPADAPILRTVAVKGFQWNSGAVVDFLPRPPDEESNNFRFMGSTSIHSITCPNLLSLSIPLRWEQLRQLCVPGGPGTGMSPMSAEMAFGILQKCPLLETFSLEITPGPDPPVTLCRMEHMRNLHVSAAHGGAEFFDHLIAPNLACLEYTSYGGLTCIPILSSSPPLERLILRAFPMATETFLEALSLVPTLRQLLIAAEPRLPPAPALDGHSPDPLAILSLNRTDTGDVLCPNLQQLELRNFSAMSDETLFEFIVGRGALEGVSRLSSIRALFPRPMQINIIPLLQPLIDDGMAVSLDHLSFPSLSYSPSTGLEQNGADWAPVLEFKQGW
ncbi:hypothetical protein DFH07DRAFT_848576 [Mycena maculata]|uniref:F-box domain-containing protein n=1 Tax=Mycena maculata TaxID=230809 RepID=A0AAD7HY08_9AGAR|nr:hypothetical protein DFH07DRAFT_848576 [Mycena maculata]